MLQFDASIFPLALNAFGVDVQARLYQCLWPGNLIAIPAKVIGQLCGYYSTYCCSCKSELGYSAACGYSEERKHLHSGEIWREVSEALTSFSHEGWTHLFPAPG